jgi:maleylacetate reductase
MIKTGRVAFGKMDAVSFGVPAGEALAIEVERIGAGRIFLMVSGSLNRNTNEIAKIKAVLGNKVVGIFDKMSPHTPRSDVIVATEIARNSKADLIVTFGGGSITDAAKAVSLCLANGVREVEQMDILHSGDELEVPTVPQISIPTTLSGGEFSAISGVTDEKYKKKDLFRHAGIMPNAVILDPTPTIHTPEWLFLSTGIRAVDHCVEGICSNKAHPYGDAQATQGLGLLTRGLGLVKKNPSDIAARLDCQMGAWMSMAPLSSGVPMGASHGIGYVLGAAFGIPHGHTSCIMLPAVMRWNKIVNNDRQALVSSAMGQPNADAGDILESLITGLGMPSRLSDVSIGKDNFNDIAAKALDTPWVPHNPRPIGSVQEVLEILALAA